MTLQPFAPPPYFYWPLSCSANINMGKGGQRGVGEERRDEEDKLKHESSFISPTLSSSLVIVPCPLPRSSSLVSPVVVYSPPRAYRQTKQTKQCGAHRFANHCLVVCLSCALGAPLFPLVCISFALSLSLSSLLSLEH